MIVCTGNDNNFYLYKDRIKDRKVFFHIKDIFNDHWNKYKSTSTRKRRPVIDKIVNKFLSCKTFFLGYSVYEQSCRSKSTFSPPKTAKSNRVLPLTKVLLNDLKTLKESDKEILFGFNDKFFVVGDIAPASNNRFSDRKNKNCEKAGVKQIRIHDFSHSCASLLIYKCANINTVSKFL